ncbi:hypothetical protein FB33_1326, partial [Cutibacterium acnes]
ARIFMPEGCAAILKLAIRRVEF